METTQRAQPIFVRYIALPQDHGSWVFLISPWLIGLFASKSWSEAEGFLAVALLAVFLLRQPVVIAVKVLTGRRSKRDLFGAQFWIIIYTLAGLAALVGLVAKGFGYLLYLVIPGIPVFILHLYLVSRREERHQIGIEIAGSGVLALAAPAAFWVGRGYPDPMGWWLFGLVWLQSAASIVYAYLRLEQRKLENIPVMPQRLRLGKRALTYTTFNVVLVAALSIAGYLPVLLPLPYGLQWGEALWGTLRPAVGFKPSRIGFRQLIVSVLFTILFILCWNF